jgi:hypothetical protein
MFFIAQFIAEHTADIGDNCKIIAYVTGFDILTVVIKGLKVWHKCNDVKFIQFSVKINKNINSSS